MWLTWIKQLLPFQHELRPETPIFLEKAFGKAGRFWKSEKFIPVRLISLLGKCNAAAYPDYPNSPKHHIEHCRDSQDHLLRDAGKYYWVDFDVFWRDEGFLQLHIVFSADDASHNYILWEDEKPLYLRMVFNTGVADCNDGAWGVVWDRNTGEVIANLVTYGPEETTIQAISQKYISICEYYPIWFPTSFDQEDDPIS